MSVQVLCPFVNQIISGFCWYEVVGVIYFGNYSLSDVQFPNVLYSAGCFFTLLTVLFAVQVFNLM